MSIRKKLTLFMLFIGLLPTLVVSIFAYATISNSLTRKTADQLVSAATKQEQKINGLLQKRHEEAIELSNKFDLQKGLGDYLATGNRQEKDQLNAILLDKKVATPDIQTIYLADLNGKVIASSLKTSEGSQLNREDTGMAAGQETNTTVREDPRDGINKLYITTKVSVNKNQSGLVSIVFRIDDIIAAMQDYTGLGATGETVVAKRDQAGNIISLFPLRFDTDAALKVTMNSLELFSSFAGGYREATDYRGQGVMVAAKATGFADWVIATKIDKSEALAQTDQLRSAFLGIVVMSSIGIMIIAFYMTRYFTKPILTIAKTAERIGKGDFAARVELRHNDEIGMLGDSVNRMGLSLRDFVASIEGQRHRLEIILNSITESILAIDKQGTIIIANQAASKLSERSVEQLVGKKIQDIFMWQKAGKPFVINYAQDGTAYYDSLEYFDQAGARHYIKIIIARISGEQEQKAAQTIVTIHDETKSKDLDAMKVDFVSMAAHELRTPLAAIRGYLELINFGKVDKTDTATKYLNQALKSTAELGDLINNLLDVTRIERGTLIFNLDKVDIAKELMQAVENTSFSAKDKKIKLSFNGPTRDCFVIGDRIALREVINNLITNAITYTNKKGSVEVTLSQEDKNYVVSVKDTGIGIAQESQANLFTKFYRVHGGLNSGSTGTGLGLFISKSIIDRHEGSIDVMSQEGIGSTFTFKLPIFDESQFARLQSQRQPQIIVSRRQHGWITKNITR